MNQTPPWYEKWLAHHCALIATNHADYKSMLRALWGQFEKHGVTADELGGATTRFIRNAKEVGDKWETHYSYLIRHIFDVRESRANWQKLQEMHQGAADAKEDSKKWIGSKERERLLKLIGRLPDEDSK